MAGRAEHNGDARGGSLRGLLRALFMGQLLVLALAAAALTYAPIPSAWIEANFSRGIYRDAVAFLSPITERTGISIALVLVALLILALWAAPWLFILGVRRRRATGAGLGTALRRAGLSCLAGLLAIALIVVIWFNALWGLGYRRVPAPERLGLDLSEIQAAEADRLRQLALDVILRDVPAEPGARNVDRAVASISRAMAQMVWEWEGEPIVLPRRVKALPAGTLLMHGTSGICAPLTLEPNVDGGLPDAAFVWTAAHELGHVAGACREDEATLYGFVAGLRADDPFARYAVALDLYMDLLGQLPKEQTQAARNALPEIAREDRRKASEAYGRYRIKWVQRANQKVYTRYLQAQGIAEGMKNYSRGVVLFAGAYRKGLARFPSSEAAPAAAPAA